MRTAGQANAARNSYLILGILLFLGSAYFYQDPEWNGNSRLNLTRAIVEERTLSIDSFHEDPDWATGDKAFFRGHFYSDKAIGTSFMAVPIYYLLFRVTDALAIELDASTIKHVLTTSVMGAAFTLAGLSMYSIALQLGNNSQNAVVPTLALAFGTMLWPYSAVFYGHVPSAGFLAAGFALLIRLMRSSQDRRSGTWFWLGTCMGLGFLSDHTSALVILGLMVYAVFAVRNLGWAGKFQELWPAAVGLLGPGLLFLLYNMAVYGRPIAFGYAYEVEERFQNIMSLGLMGMRLPTAGASYHITLDPKFGVFWLSPVLLLAPLGYFRALLYRRHLAEVIMSLYAIAVVFAMNAASYLWYGGSAFGPRLLIACLPFFIVPLALLPRGLATPLAVLGLGSAANMLIPLVGQIQYSRLEFRPDRGGFFVDESPFRGFSLLYNYGLPKAVDLARGGRSPWTLGTALGLPLWGSLLALAVGVGLPIRWLRRH